MAPYIITLSIYYIVFRLKNQEKAPSKTAIKTPFYIHITASPKTVHPLPRHNNIIAVVIAPEIYNRDEMPAKTPHKFT